MATEVTVIVDPDGGAGYDYTSLAAAIAGEARNLVTADEQLTIKCRCTGGTADGGATINGFTTDATRFIKIWTDPSESYRHNGTYQTGNKYRIEVNDRNCLLILDANTYVYGLQFKNTGTTSSRTVYCDVAPIRMAYCFLWNAQTGGTSRDCFKYEFSTTTVSYVYNNIFYGAATIGLYSTGIYGAALAIFNNTFANCGTGFSGVNRNYRPTLVNNIFTGCTTAAVGYVSAATRNNATDVASLGYTPDTGGGTDDRINQTFTFVGATYALESTDTGALGVGTDDPGSGLYSDDILGNARTSTWDIGAFEYVSAGYSLTSSNGSFTLSGQAAGVRADRAIQGANGPVNIAGQSVGLYDNKLVSADYSQFNLSGQDSGLKSTRLLSSDTGLYNVTGQDATLLYTSTGAYALIASYGDYSVLGRQSNLLKTSILTSQYGSFSLSGQDSLFRIGKLVSAEPGVYHLSGQALSFIRSYVLSSNTGLYVLSGQDASLVYIPHEELLLLAETGVYTVVFPTIRLKPSSEYAVTCSKIFNSPIFAILYADSEIIAAVSEKSIVSKELVYNERDICW